MFSQENFEIVERTIQKLVVWCEVEVQSDCQNYKKCWQTGLEGNKFVR